MQHPVCPHCGEPLKAFDLPEAAGYEGEFQLACFNDECSYYQRGWQHMEQNYAVKACYRYRVDPATGKASPLAVWSETALVDRILDDSSDDPPSSPHQDQKTEKGNPG